MEYQMRDQYDDVLGKDMVLKHVRISPDDILARFEQTLGWFLKSNYLRYERESVCVEALIERISDLELLFKYGKKEEAVRVGDIMKKRLLSIENDLDGFPAYILEIIDMAIGIEY